MGDRSIDETVLGAPAPAADGGAGEDAFISELFDRVLTTVRASNAVPQGSAPAQAEDAERSGDYGFHASFPAFRSLAEETGNDILNLISVILEHVRPGADFAVDNVTDVADPEVFDRVADIVEELLEDVSTHVDATAADGAAGAAGGGGGGVGGSSSMVEQLRTVAASARQQTSRYQTMLSSALDIPKPQEKFPAGSINNAKDSVWQPLVAPERLRLLEDGSGYAHPYEAEIKALGYASLPPPPDAPAADPAEEPPEPTWVDTPEGLNDLVAHVLSVEDGAPAREVGVALSHHSLRSFHGLTCLLQLSTRRRDFLVDALALRGRMRVLGKVLMNAEVLKVLHGADHEVLWLQRDCGLYLVNLFDARIAARQLGYEASSLAHLLERHCGQAPDKTHQLSDWRVRPLPEPMASYAQRGSRLLLPLYDALRRALHAAAPGAGVQRVLEAGKEVALRRYEPEPFHATGYRALQARQSGDAPREAALAALWEWRDAVARREDESPGYVLSASGLFTLARLGAEGATPDGVCEALRPLPPLVRKHAADVAQLLSLAAAGGPPALQTPRRAAEGDGDVDEELSRIASGAKPPRSALHTPQPVLNSALNAELARLNCSNSPFCYAPPPIPLPSGAEAAAGAGRRPAGARVSQASPVLGTAALYDQAGWRIQVQANRAQSPHGLGLGGARKRPPGAAAAEGARGSFGGVPLFSLSLSDFLEEAGGQQDSQEILRAVMGGIADDAKEESDAEGAEEEDEFGAPLPQSLEEIYRVSNRNRKRNKDKKKLKYMTQEEAQAFLAQRKPHKGGAAEESSSKLVADMASERRHVAGREETLGFMRAIGWIDEGQEHLFADAPQSAAGGGRGQREDAPKAAWRDGGREGRGRRPPQQQDSTYDRTVAAIGAFGGAVPVAQMPNPFLGAAPQNYGYAPQQQQERKPKGRQQGGGGGARRNHKDGRSMTYGGGPQGQKGGRWR